MKKIVTALANPTLNNELRKYEKYDVIFNDLFYQEAVIEILEKNDIDVLILSILLQGQWDIIEFLDKLKKKGKIPRIILIVDELNEETRNAIISKGIYDIFCDNEIEVSTIIEAIDREEPINKKLEKIRQSELEKHVELSNYNNSSNKKIKEKINTFKEPVYINRVQKQEIIAVTGINGSGKSTILSNISKTLAKKTNSKILVIDLDTLNGNIDELYGINKVPQNVEILLDEDKKCGLNYISELINKNRFDSNVFDELMIEIENIHIITGNTSLHFCQNVLNEDCYNKILECAKEKYDYILIDTSSNIFLDSTKWAIQKANRVIFVTENNYLCAKKSNQLLNIYINTWGVWKNKIQIVINKFREENLEKELISNILGDLDVIGNIKLGEEKVEINYENILENINYIPKITLMNKVIYIKDKIINKIIHKFNNKKQEISPKGVEISHAN